MIHLSSAPAPRTGILCAELDPHTGGYSFKFDRIGGGPGAWATVHYGCPNGAQKTTAFGVARPNYSSYTTRALY
jgi:hypothetical protein